LPWVDYRLIDQVAIALPAGIGPPGKHVGDVLPTLPSLRGGRDDASCQAPGNGDLDLLASLDPTYEVRCILSQFA